MSLKIDVVLPTYNRASWVTSAVESVLAQTYPHFHLYLIDDGSSDETEKVLAKFHSHPKFSYHKIENSGVSVARNYGIKLGTSPWIAFLDSDDLWLENKLAKQVEMALNSPNPLIHGEEIWIRRGVRVNPKKIHKKEGGDIFERSLKLCLISPSAAMISRKCLEELGAFDPEFTVCEDYDLWLRLTSRFRVSFVEDPIVVKRGGHDDQLSSRYKAMDYWRVLSMKKLWEEGELKSWQKKALLDEFLIKCEVLSKGYLKHQHYQKWQQAEQWKLWCEKERQTLSFF